MTGRRPQSPKDFHDLVFHRNVERFVRGNRGMGFSKEQKSDVTVLTFGLVYRTPFIGGLVATGIWATAIDPHRAVCSLAAGSGAFRMPGESTFTLSLC
ncbi:hypothetical protein FQR65_LT20423 [Abscondita terminalis]|nr:hypothetical protein FQR65_LT20423 [Abscondita terminalis]